MQKKIFLTTLTLFVMAALFFSCSTAPAGEETLTPVIPSEYSFNVIVNSDGKGTGTLLDTTTTAGNYDPGTSIVVEASHGADNSFLGWYDQDGYLASRSLKYSFNLQKNISLEARFIRNDYVVTFPSSHLKDAVVEAFYPEYSTPLTYANLSRVRSIRIEGRWASYKALDSLEGIQYLTGLRKLEITYTTLNDIAKLNSLHTLVDLKLYNNYIRDITPLKNLKNLKNLDLGDNRLYNIEPLKNLVSLNSLGLASCRLNSIEAIRPLTSLTSLKLNNNFITDFTPISEMKGMKYLYLNRNRELSNINFISDFTSLLELNISTTSVSNLSALRNSMNLIYLNIINTKVRDITPLIENSYFKNRARLYITDILSDTHNIPADQIAILTGRGVTVE